MKQVQLVKVIKKSFRLKSEYVRYTWDNYMKILFGFFVFMKREIS